MDLKEREYQEFYIPYGNDSLSAQIEKKRIKWILDEKPNLAIDLQSELLKALDQPTGSKPLAQLIADKNPRSVLILIDDNTRATPQHLILPILIQALIDLGMQHKDIHIMVCLGTHRPLSSEEMRERVGEAMYQRCRCLNLPTNAEDFIGYGITEAGTPIEVSREYLAHDFKIAVGNIIPHMYAGWAGGAKMIQPGVTSALTTAKTHLLAAHSIKDILGNAENPIRQEMEEIAIRTGLDFIVNTVIDNFNTVVAVVAGDVVAAHRKGVAIAQPLFTHEIDRKVSVVIAGAHPADRDLWQGFKPLNNCGVAVEDDGVLILVIEAPEGIAPDHPELVALGKKPVATVLQMLDRHEIEDEVAAATYMAYCATRDRMSIILVSDGIREEADRIGAYSVRTIDEALALADQLVDGKDIGIIPCGADIIIKFKKGSCSSD